MVSECVLKCLSPPGYSEEIGMTILAGPFWGAGICGAVITSLPMLTVVFIRR